MLAVLKRTKAHREYVKEVEQYWPEGRRYITDHKEVFARAFNALMAHEFRQRTAQPTSPLAKADDFESYSPSELATFGEELRRILRATGIEKACRRLASWRR